MRASSGPGGPADGFACRWPGRRTARRSSPGRREARVPELLLVAPDFTSERRFPSRLGAGPIGFWNRWPRRAQHVPEHHRQRCSVAVLLRVVRGCRPRDGLVADIELPDSTMGLAGFSLHPDGTRFVTSLELPANRHLDARGVRPAIVPSNLWRRMTCQPAVARSASAPRAKDRYRVRGSAKGWIVKFDGVAA